MPRKSDIRLAQLLVQKQWCTLKQVNSALAVQGQAVGPTPRDLGRTLLHQGLLGEEQLKEALAILGTLVLSCPECGHGYSVPDYDKKRSYACRECGGELAFGESTDSVVPYDSSELAHPAAIEPALSPPPRPSGSVPERPVAEAARIVSPASEAHDPDAFIGRVLGGCKLLEKVASGGMGVIYKAQQLNLNRTVAVKVLSHELASDRTFVRRFLEEARSAAQLNHGSIVHVLDVGDYQGIFYFTMEYVDGVNLKTILKDQKLLPVDRSIEIMLQVSGALEHAHARGVIHRDIKPENIMITSDGVVKLADLGLAKRMGPSTADSVTQTGSILGTPFYMPPEQAKDFSRVDERSDIYSLGVTLYKTITGKVPFTGRTPLEVMIRVIEGKHPRLRDLRPDVPEEVEKIVERMMARDPGARYQRVGELIQDFRRYLEEERRGEVAQEQV